MRKLNQNNFPEAIIHHKWNPFQSILSETQTWQVCSMNPHHLQEEASPLPWAYVKVYLSYLLGLKDGLRKIDAHAKSREINNSGINQLHKLFVFTGS